MDKYLEQKSNLYFLNKLLITHFETLQRFDSELIAALRQAERMGLLPAKQECHSAFLQSCECDLIVIQHQSFD